MSKELDDTIAHWRRLLDCKSPKEFRDEGFSGFECPLCQNRQVQRPISRTMCDLEGSPCPVFVHTGARLCRGTPYAAALKAIRSYAAPFWPLTHTDRATLEQVVKSIEKEIAFLEKVKD